MIRDEINTIKEGITVDYEGIFSAPDLLSLIDSYFRKRGYTKHIMSHSEKRTKTGRKIEMRLRPWRQVKKEKLEVQVWINISNITDVKKKIDGITLSLNKGKVNIVIDAFVISNMRGQWEARAEYIFIRTILTNSYLPANQKTMQAWFQGMQLNLQMR